MGNYFTATKITTHDNTISSECNIDIFVNKKSLDENLEIIENLEPIEVKTDTNDIEPLKENEEVKIDNKMIDQSPQTTLTSNPIQPLQITPQPVENKLTEVPRSLRPSPKPSPTPSPKPSPTPSPKTSPKPSPKTSPKPSPKSSPKSSQSIIGGELKVRSDSDLSINEEVSSDDNTINTQIQKHKKRNKKKKKNVSEIKPEIKPQTEL
jgi:hypothetical protein